MYMIREYTATSLESTAKILNKKDHTTVIHGINKIKEEMNKNSDIKNKVDIIKKKISV